MAQSIGTAISCRWDRTFGFADSVHPTIRYSELFGKFVEQRIAASGLGR
jgi:phospholipase/lecithinase/hemolysin